jgi:hypothetical protein
MTDTPTDAIASVESEGAVLLDEFCRELSTSDNRVELIAGFHASELQAGCMRATRGEFVSHFADYLARPVA